MTTKQYILPILAALGASACIPIQEVTWKAESSANNRIEERFVRNKSEETDENKIMGVVSKERDLKITAWYEKKDNTYRISENVAIEPERKYLTGKNVPSAVVADIGLGVTALGVIFAVEHISPSLVASNVIGGIVIGTGILTYSIAGPIYLKIPKKTYSTEEYRNLEEPLGEAPYNCAMCGYHQQLTQSIVLDKVPAIDLSLHLHSSDFTFDNGKSDLEISTDVEGHAYTHLTPARDTFAFSVEEYETSALVRDLQKRGFSKKKVIPLIENAAVPVTYKITVESKGKDGKDYSNSIPVKGFEVTQESLERMILDF